MFKFVQLHLNMHKYLHIYFLYIIGIKLHVMFYNQLFSVDIISIPHTAKWFFDCFDYFDYVDYINGYIVSCHEHVLKFIYPLPNCWTIRLCPFFLLLEIVLQ